jgi:hypothetical protein
MVPWIRSVLSKLSRWLSSHPDDDPDAPKQEPFSSGRPHGQGGAGA